MMKKLFQKESPVMWTSWGELIGMGIAAVFMVPGILLTICGGIYAIPSEGNDYTVFLVGLGALVIGILIMLVTQIVVHRS